MLIANGMGNRNKIIAGFAFRYAQVSFLGTINRCLGIN